MILKKIKLENIRSYKEIEVEFPLGSTLLSGDIGSGKTSILLAIEFALFGLQPGQRGTSLLRNGEKQGKTILEFEISGKSVIIERILKKGKTVTQDYCSIIIDEEKKELSVTELKNAVLDLLNYPSEFTKKQNMLYKFTVYTPQEEMKQIILEDPSIRINTLRHIFGIDKYKRILENTSILSSKIREEKRIKEVQTETLEQDKEVLITKEQELEDRHHNLSSLQKELFIKTEKRKEIEEEKDEINQKIEEKRKLESEIEKTKIMLSNKRNSIEDNKKTISQIELQIRELKEFSFEESLIEEIETKINKLKSNKEKLTQEVINLNLEINTLHFQDEQNRKLEQQISNLDKCPTCLQEVDPIYRANVLNKIHSELGRNKNIIEEFEQKKKAINEQILTTNTLLVEKEKNLNELKILRIKLQTIEEKQMRIREIDELIASLMKDVSLLIQHNESLNLVVNELKKYEEIFQQKQEELQNAFREEKQAEIKIAELNKEIDVFSIQIEEMKDKIRKTQDIKKKLDHLIKLENWLSKNFISLISYIEKNVMIKLKQDFSVLFNEWFSMLVSDSFNVRLDDNFTPIIEQQDYELDYSYLSGGERTAVALAYRLALNQVINSFLSKIKTKDLVILDEPTDGFSEQQLDKMRDILQELNVNQLILVSHEQKIEGFVENVIRFKKDAGISKIEK